MTMIKIGSIHRRALLTAAAAAGVGILVPGHARAEEPSELDRRLDEVSRARASLKTLRGPFVQERAIGLLASKVRSTGTLTLVRPDRLRWELDPPDAITYWVTPEGLAYRSMNGEARVSGGGSTAKIAAALDDLRTVLGGDLQRLRARYDLRLVSVEPELAFEATPKAADGPVKLQRIAFALGPDRIRPTRVELIEGPRDKTTITFGALTRDTPIDPKTMHP